MINFLSDLFYDVSYEYNCEEYGCDDEGICRCGVVDKIEVKPIEDQLNLINKIATEYNIEKTIVINFMKKHGFDDNLNYTFAAESDYYGEVLVSITFNNFNVFENDIFEYKNPIVNIYSLKRKIKID